MPRRLRKFTIEGLCLLSLFACLGTSWLWWRSDRLSPSASPDSLNLTSHEPLYWFISEPGQLTLCGQRGKDWNSPQTVFKLLGLEYACSRVGRSFLWNLIVPYWMLVVWLAALPVGLPALRCRGSLIERRRRLGLCSRCGYDLTGNTSGRCSECGEALTSATSRVNVS